MSTVNTAANAAAANRRRRRGRRGKRTLHYALISLFLLAVGLILSLTVFFKIESVTTIGTDKYPPDAIAVASGIEIGENLFRIDTKAAQEAILQNFPYIESVGVRLKLPHMVQLEVTQCKPAGALALNGDEYMLITREGKVLERGIVFIPEDVPLIKGVPDSGAVPGETLTFSAAEEKAARQRLGQLEKLTAPPQSDDLTVGELDVYQREQEALAKKLSGTESAAEALRMLDYLFRAMDETGFSHITNVDMTDIYNMNVVYENRLLLKLGTEADLPYKLDFINTMIANEIPQNAEGIIDATNAQKSRAIFLQMPLSDALSGKKHADKPASEKPVQSQTEEDLSAAEKSDKNGTSS